MLQAKNNYFKNVEVYGADTTQPPVRIALLEDKVSAGFPSSAENFVDKVLDLNQLLIKHPAATYFVRVKGNSMENAGIKPNDILIVDRGVQPTHNKIVLARINDEFTVKRVSIEGTQVFLVPENDAYQPIAVTPEMDCEIWGVVTFIIHQAV